VRQNFRVYLYVTLHRWLQRLNPTGLGIALLTVAGLILTIQAYFSLKTDLRTDVATQTRIIAQSSTAALAFRNSEALSETLSALQASEYIERAVIVDQHDRIQSSYSSGAQNSVGAGSEDNVFAAQEFFPDHRSDKPQARFTLTRLYLVQPIIDKDRQLGVVFVAARLQLMYERLAVFVGTVILALLVFGALGSALLAVGRLRGKVSRAQQKLYRLAYVDSVTQLPNRNVFNRRLQQSLKRMQRRNGRMALLFLDLDNFKFVNDTFGHAIGDRLLFEVTRRLSSTLRETDLLCRLGGDEFALVLEDVAGQQAAADTARRLLGTLKAPFELEGREIYVSASIGISLYPDDGADLKYLFKNADSAMYHAKELGRNNFQFFSEELNHRTARRLALESGLRRALQHEELYLVYQPIVELDRRTVTAVEALLRWQSPDGPIHPDEFIPVAEEGGMILPIAYWTLRHVLEQLRTWRRTGLTELEVAVNLSSRQFRDPNLVAQIATILADTETPPQALWLEITETTLMADTAATYYKLRELTALGVRLAVDDFGTGYSSLSYLKKLPIAKLKIDRSFIADLPTDSDAAAITEAILAMAYSLRMKTVAEGVESIEQMDFLERHGCNAVQGYRISRPVPAEKIPALVHRIEKSIQYCATHA
jgi:diguanylate cyclase (GGDEF)-like protein